MFRGSMHDTVPPVLHYKTLARLIACEFLALDYIQPFSSHRTIFLTQTTRSAAIAVHLDTVGWVLCGTRRLSLYSGTMPLTMY